MRFGRMLRRPLGLVVALKLLATVGDHFLLRAFPASESAIAMACLRLLTLGPLPGPGLPLRSVPALYSDNTLPTLSIFFDRAISGPQLIQG